MKNYLIVSVLLSFFLHNSSVAQDLIIYPAENQSAEQQSTDEGACYVWAKNNSGVDPLNLTVSVDEQSAQRNSRRGGAVRGAARGAVVGGIIGDDSDDVRNAAAAGAAVGIRRQRRQNQAAEERQQQQQTAAIVEVEMQRELYNRYYVTCLEGRGYEVN